MKNLIPKSLAKQKGVFYKNISWWDIVVVILEIGISCGISFGFIFIDWWIRLIIAIGISLILFIFTLPYSRSNDVRMYKVWWYKIKYLVSPKKYNNSNEINPYKQLSEKYILTKAPKNGKSHFISMIKIRGLDISTLDNSEVQIKLDQFHNFLKQQKNIFQ